MKKVSLLVLAAFYQLVSHAQGGSSSTDVDVNLKGDTGGTNYWIWIIGAVVFILLLVALLRGRGTNKVVEKKTIVRD